MSKTIHCRECGAVLIASGPFMPLHSMSKPEEWGALCKTSGTRY